jgi:hypothetical protein
MIRVNHAWRSRKQNGRQNIQGVIIKFLNFFFFENFEANFEKMLSSIFQTICDLKEK